MKIFGMFASKADERTPARVTSTQYVLQLAGYDWALRQIPSPTSATVLDAACGEGFGTDYLARRCKEAVGIDVSAEAVSACRRRYGAPNLRFELMDVERMDFPDRRFDAVISQDTIEHVPQDRKFLAEIRRVLRPGGPLFLIAPMGIEGAKPANPFHWREYSGRELKAVLSEGFSDIRLFSRRPGSRIRAAESGMDGVRRLDPLGLRRIFGIPFRHWLADGWLRMTGRPRLEQLGVEDVLFEEGEIPETHWAVACRRPAESGRP